jgi:hypothetical protein
LTETAANPADHHNDTARPAPALPDTLPNLRNGPEVSAAEASTEADRRRSERARRDLDRRLEDGWTAYAD